MTATKAELEQHLLGQRDDEEAWAVYGDLLAQEGAPPGEVMALQRELAAAEASMRQRLADKLKNTFFLHRDWYWGAAWDLAKPLTRDDEALRWKHGFVDAVKVPRTLPSSAVEVFFGAPALRFLRTLSLDDAALIPELARAPHPVFELELRGQTPWHGVEERVLDATHLAQGFPRLRSLFVSGERFTVNAVLPQLVRLECGEALPTALEPAALVRALSEGRFPALRELAMTFLGDPALEQLSALPVAAQLERLECPLSDASARWLLAHRERFPSLQAVRPGRSLAPELKAELDAAFKKRRKNR